MLACPGYNSTGGVGVGGSVWGAGRRANGGRVNGRKVGGRGDGRRHWELEPCTFTPNVIGARKGMDQAQQYLQVRALGVALDSLVRFGVGWAPSQGDESDNAIGRLYQINTLYCDSEFLVLALTYEYVAIFRIGVH